MLASNSRSSSLILPSNRAYRWTHLIYPDTILAGLYTDWRDGDEEENEPRANCWSDSPAQVTSLNTDIWRAYQALSKGQHNWMSRAMEIVQ
jgi:hypothetical protein